MAWVKVPVENHPLFHAALPKDPRVETMQMFGGVAAKVNGHIFAGLFGLSAIVALSDADKAEALALEGAGFFDPMGNGRMRSDKIMLPVAVIHDAKALRKWIARAFKTAAALPPKAEKPKKKPTAKKAGAKKIGAKKRAAKKPAARR